MKIDGRCHCGYITYEAEIDPEKVMICHCSDCQTLSGSTDRHLFKSRSAEHLLGIIWSAIVEEVGSLRQSYVERTVSANGVIDHRESNTFFRLTPRCVCETPSWL